MELDSSIRSLTVRRCRPVASRGLLNSGGPSRGARTERATALHISRGRRSPQDGEGSALARRTDDGPLVYLAETPQMITLIGCPGAGKTDVATDLVTRVRPGAVLISLEEIRGLVSPHADNADQDVTAAAVDRLHREVGAYLRNGRSVVIDAINSTEEQRAHLLAIARQTGALAVAVVVVVPLAVARARNELRSPEKGPSGWSFRVPDHELVTIAQQVAADIPQLPAQGWDAVVIRR